MGCRVALRRDWSIRVYHELLMCGGQGEFLTLTYEQMPAGGSLDPRHLQAFLKAVRRRHGAGIRFFACGEYGQNGSRRPHYHVLLLNFKLPKEKRSDIPATRERPYVTYRSDYLSMDVWRRGYVLGGEANFKSVKYCTGYIVDKLDGEHGEVVRTVRDERGKLIVLEPEFSQMSLKPPEGASYAFGGLGACYVMNDEYRSKMIAHCSVVIDGKELPIPRYYLEIIREIDPEGYNTLRLKRKEYALEKSERDPDWDTNRRLAIDERVLHANLNRKRKGSL